MNLIFKKLNIRPDGNLVNGGSASYTLDPLTGHVTYSALLIAHYLFSNHNFNSNGVYSVDPKMLKSADVKEGQVLQFGKVSITVQKIENKMAQCLVVVPDPKIEGNAIVSLIGDIIELKSISATGSIYGMSFTLEAE